MQRHLKPALSLPSPHNLSPLHLLNQFENKILIFIDIEAIYKGQTHSGEVTKIEREREQDQMPSVAN